MISKLNYVLTLVEKSDGIVDDRRLRRLADQLAAADARSVEVHPLAPTSVDIVFKELDPEVASRIALEELPGTDFAVQPEAGRRKRLLVADLESTVIRNEMLDELAEIAGRGAAVRRITARAMNGELDFRSALRERVAMLRGLGVETLADASRRIEVDPGAAVLVATMRAHGAPTALVSGGFGYFAEPIRRALGFDVRLSNELEIEDGVLTGRVREPILDREAKLDALRRLCAEHGLDPADAAAVGDGANDLSMLAAAGLGVAFHAKPAVAAAARFRVDHGDLSTLLFFQGYAAADWTVEAGSASSLEP